MTGTTTLLIGPPAHPVVVTPTLLTKESVKSLGPAFAPLVWLGVHADDCGAVLGNPISIKALGDALGCSVSTAKTMLKRLRSGGFIKTEATRQGLNIWLLPGKGLDFRLPDVGGGAGNNPPQPETVSGVDKNLPVAAVTASPEDFYKRDRFRQLLGAYRTACQAKGREPRVTQEDQEALLTCLRAHPAVTADEILRQFQNFGVVSDRERFTLGDFAGFFAASAANLNGGSK